MNVTEQSFLKKLKSDIKIKRIFSENIGGYADFLPKTEKNNLAYGVENADGSPRGAVCALMEDGIIEVKSLAVSNEHRREKIGSTLLCKIKELADENGIDTVSAEYLADGTEKIALDAFFRSCGFIIKDGMELISFKAADIADNDTYKKLSGVSMDDFKYCTLGKLPADVKQSFAALCAKPEITELAPSSAKGEFIDELSLTYVFGGEVKAFLVITDLNGTLYINSAYADPSAPTAIVKLLTLSFKTLLEKYSSYERICVSALNEGSLKFIMNFIGKDSGKTEKITTTAAVCSLSSQLTESGSAENADADALAEQTMDGMEILVPRTMRLNGFLSNNGIQSDITVLDNELPALLVTNDSGVTFVRYNATNESFSHFTLTAYTYFTSASPDANALCSRFNSTQPTAAAFIAENGEIIVRATLAEGGIPVSENQFVFFWNTFADSLGLFRMMNTSDEE